MRDRKRQRKKAHLAGGLIDREDWKTFSALQIRPRSFAILMLLVELRRADAALGVYW